MATPSFCDFGYVTSTISSFGQLCLDKSLVLHPQPPQREISLLLESALCTFKQNIPGTVCNMLFRKAKIASLYQCKRRRHPGCGNGTSRQQKSHGHTRTEVTHPSFPGVFLSQSLVFVHGTSECWPGGSRCHRFTKEKKNLALRRLYPLASLFLSVEKRCWGFGCRSWVPWSL